MKQSPAGMATQSEYARHRGVDRSYVSRLVRRGCLIMRGGLVDVDASDRVLDGRPAIVDERAAPSPVDASAGRPRPTTYIEARTAVALYSARLKKQDLDVRQSKLVEASVVEARWAAILVVLKERALAVPDRLAPEGTALTDQRQVRDVLRRDVHALLRTLSQEVRHAH